MPIWRKQQLVALATLYYQTGGGQRWEPPPIFDVWLNDTVNECAWYHADDTTFQPNCTAAGQYQYLHVGADGLRHELPPELALLTTLNSIILRHNDLEGPIPTRLGALTRLTHLTLGGNSFSGTIPSELGALTRLTLLVLRGNRLTGELRFFYL